MASSSWLAASVFALLAVMAAVQSADAHFNIEEATVASIQAAYKSGKLTSVKLVSMYLERIEKLNPYLHAILDINPDALAIAAAKDQERMKAGGYIGGLHGIPIILKDNIGTKDKMNTTAGSLALLYSIVPRDATIVKKLRKKGVIILAKANLSEWANFRSSNPTNGWSGYGGFTKNPYGITFDTCGSSSGSGSGTAASLATVSIGSETDGSIICPSSFHSLAGIKPTVGLVSRAGVVPLSSTQDTTGPICRTLTDATLVLDAIVGTDKRDKATCRCKGKTPKGSYTKFLKKGGLKGKRIGVYLSGYFTAGGIYLGGGIGFEANYTGPDPQYIIDKSLSHLALMKKLGAKLVYIDDFPYFANFTGFQDPGEKTILVYDMKHDLDVYFKGLVKSRVRSLAEAIQFNIANKEVELATQDQFWFEQAVNTSTKDPQYKAALNNTRFITKHGVDYLFKKYKLDAMVSPTNGAASSVPAVARYPAITIPAGYTAGGMPFGMTFFGLACSEPILLECAYSFEQATKLRKPPTFIGYNITW